MAPDAWEPGCAIGRGLLLRVCYASQQLSAAEVRSGSKSGKSPSEQKFPLYTKKPSPMRGPAAPEAERPAVSYVFGPDGGLERDTGKDQEIVASALAHGRGGSPDWLLQPMDCLAGALRSGAAIADHMQARRPATISRLSAAPMRHPIRLWT